MTRVAFWFDRPEQYTGGLNYIRNLLFAIARTPGADIEPLVFFGHHVSDRSVAGFSPLARVVRTSLLDRKSLPWLLHRIAWSIFGSLFFVERLMARHAVDVVSHAEHIHARRRRLKMISWIPDFQYLHLPQLFPGLSVSAESARMQRIVKHSDVVVLSSQAALQDLRQIAVGEPLTHVRVVPFVSQPTSSAEPDEVAAWARVVSVHDVPERFFFLPNQFWEHKNHGVVFEAVAQLKSRGIDVVVICTGNFRDYRQAAGGYVDRLRAFIDAEGLASHIRLLGLIDYGDVLVLMRNAIAVLNPSRFEGWSSTVEEARSMGQRLILSDIAVHREQAPPRARYFDVDDATGLATLMAELSGSAAERGDALRFEAAISLRNRTVAYGQAYVGIVRELMR